MDIIVTLYGLVFGSFHNVVAYRVPRRESLMTPPSHCPQCDHRLGAVDLVPVLSFLWLRGRCRHCGAAISWRYPLVEAFTGLLFWVGYRLFGVAAATLLFWAVASLLLVVALVSVDRITERRRTKQRSDSAAVRAAEAMAAAARDEAGVSLIEVLAALTILGVVVVAVMGLYTASGRERRGAAALAEATNLAQAVLEEAHYAAGFGPLPSLPPQWSNYTITQDGVTYQVQVTAAPADNSPTLTRVSVQVGWNLNSPASINLTTLVSSQVAASKQGNGGGNHYGQWLGSPPPWAAAR